LHEEDKTPKDMSFDKHEIAKLIMGKRTSHIKEITRQLIMGKASWEELTRRKEFRHTTDKEDIEKECVYTIHKHQKAASDYKKGDTKALQFLIGQALKRLKRKADPLLVTKILKKKIEKESRSSTS
jgi:Asp-tRNA(Asn)/Glu-tRNA(Gln) amidotransferase B subunit